MLLTALLRCKLNRLFSLTLIATCPAAGTSRQYWVGGCQMSQDVLETIPAVCFRCVVLLILRSIGHNNQLKASLQCGCLVQDWIAVTAEFLKSLDPNHLICAGTEGFLGSSTPG